MKQTMLKWYVLGSINIWYTITGFDNIIIRNFHFNFSVTALIEFVIFLYQYSFDLIFVVHFQLWGDKMVHKISSHPVVQRVVSLGTLFALELKAEGDNAGYHFIIFLPFPPFQ